MTLLDYLRQNGKTDTKKMCQEGGCGVCTIIEMVNFNRQEYKRILLYNIIVNSILIPKTAKQKLAR